MTANQIRGRLIAEEGSIEAVAHAIKENRSALSQVINYIRANQRIRAKLASRYKITFSDALLKGTSNRTKKKEPTRITRRKRQAKTDKASHAQ